MALTLNSKSYSVAGNRAQVIADFTFDSSYAYGGEAMDPDKILGLHTIETALFETSGGYSLQYDRTNKKIQVFGPPTAPPIVFEEQHTPTATGKITLKYPPAYIMSISNLSQPMRMTTTGATLAAGQAKPDAVFAAGQLATITTYTGLNGITNGTIGDGTGWMAAGDDWAYPGTAGAHKASSASVVPLTHSSFAAVAGHTYRVIYTATITTGGIKVGLGGATGTIRTVGAPTTYTEDLTATSTGGLLFTPSGTSHLTVDEVFIYDITGTIYITYATQAWKDVWDNLVQEEVQATVAHVATLDNIPIAIQCIHADGTSSYNACLQECHDDTVAQGSCVIVHASKTLTFHATDAVTGCIVTYVKKPSSGFLYDRFIANEDFTAASNICTPAYPILLWGYSGQLPEKGATTEEFIALGGTAGTGESKLDIITAGTKITGQSITTGVGVYVWGRPTEIVTAPLEVANGADLSSLTVRGMFIGT
jgi:hypothetical protein